MLARDYSLKGKKNFERVEKEGKMIQSDSFGVAYLKRDDEEFSHFGIIVSTKISKLSVQRNRIKRAISEALRYGMTELKPGFDVVFLAKLPIVKKPTDQIMREVRETLFSSPLGKQKNV